jgi:hypothetical protein
MEPPLFAAEPLGFARRAKKRAARRGSSLSRLSYLHHAALRVVNFVQIRQIVTHDNHKPKSHTDERRP